MREQDQETLLAELRRGLVETLGRQLDGIYLFGSRARGDSQPDSDVDVLVVVRGELDYGDLIRRTSALVSGLSLKHDLVVSRSFVARDRFDREQSPFLMNIRREAVAL